MLKIIKGKLAPAFKNQPSMLVGSLAIIDIILRPIALRPYLSISLLY